MTDAKTRSRTATGELTLTTGATAITDSHQQTSSGGVAALPTAALSDDLLRGADAIAAFLFGSPRERRKVYHLAQSCRLPVFRMGSTLCARKSKLLAWIELQEAKAANAGDG